MSKLKKFDALRSKMPPKAQKRAQEKAILLRDNMALMELRQARLLSQKNLSETLQVGQAAISKLEKRADMYVSSLRRIIQAMGSELDIVAHFPEGDVRITNFKDLDNQLKNTFF
jgi:hypothetical protein